MPQPEIAAFKRLRVLVLACLAVAWSGAYASGAATGGLQAAVGAAWQRTLEGRQAEGEQARARAGKRAARSLVPEPLALEASQLEGRWYGDARVRETQAGVAIPLWLPGQRRALGAEADSDLAWAEANAGVARLELAGRVRELAWTLEALRAGHDLAVARAQTLQRMAEDVQRRVDAGELASTDALAARAEALAAQSQREQARQTLLATQSQWRLLTGLDEAPDPTEAPPPTSDVTTHPVVARARHAADRARGRLEVARQSRRAAPQLSLSVRDERPEEPVRDSVRSLGLAVRVPLGNRGLDAPRQAEAENAVAAAEIELRLARERQLAEQALAASAAAAADAQLAVAGQRAELLRRRAGLLQTAFDQGEIALVDLLRALDASAEADSDQVRQHAARGLAIARLLQAYGTLP